MKQVRYTDHAKSQIAERNILKVWIEETIASPDLVKCDKNKYYLTKKIDGKVLKVICVKEKYIKVITAFFMK